jgi:hypothetical protein
MDTFAVTAGSIVGREHVRLHRNNQDGIGIHAGEDLIVAAVTDGCSSGRFSEVGARLGAAWLAHWVPRLYREQVADIGGATATGLCQYLARIASGLAASTDVRTVVNEYLLFTFLVALITPEETMVFGMGDGVICLNGDAIVLDPGPENAPLYLAYLLVNPDALDGTAARLRREPAAFQPVVHLRRPTEEVRSLLIGTDGVSDVIARAGEPLQDGSPPGGLESLSAGANPMQLQRRLVVLGELHRRLADDTTVAVIKRR